MRGSQWQLYYTQSAATELEGQRILYILKVYETSQATKLQPTTWKFGKDVEFLLPTELILETFLAMC